ncbi:MAG: hypothetical protein PVTTEEND_001613 [Candidatus Fervidibacter sp.]
MRFFFGLLAVLSVAVLLTGCGGAGNGGISGTEAVIRGSVLDANANPVVGAEVRAVVGVQIVRTTSGADGSFVLRFPLTSQTSVTVTAQRGNESTFASVVVAPGTESTVTLRFAVSGGFMDMPPPPPF